MADVRQPTYEVCKDSSRVSYVSEETYSQESPNAAIQSTQDQLKKEIIENTPDKVVIDEVALDAALSMVTRDFGCVTPDGRFAVDASRFNRDAFEQRYSQSLGSAARIGVGGDSSSVRTNEEMEDIESVSVLGSTVLDSRLQDIIGIEDDLDAVISLDEYLSAGGFTVVAMGGEELLDRWSQGKQDIPLKDRMIHDPLYAQRKVESEAWRDIKSSDEQMDCLEASGVLMPQERFANMPELNDPSLKWQHRMAIRLIRNRGKIALGTGALVAGGIAYTLSPRVDGGADDYLTEYDRMQRAVPSGGEGASSDLDRPEGRTGTGQRRDAPEIEESDADRVVMVAGADAFKGSITKQIELASMQQKAWRDIKAAVAQDQIEEAEAVYVSYLVEARDFCRTWELPFEAYKGNRMGVLLRRLKARSWSNTIRTNSGKIVAYSPAVGALLLIGVKAAHRQVTGLPSGETSMDLDVTEYEGVGRKVPDARRINEVERQTKFRQLDILRGANECSEEYLKEYEKLSARDRQRYAEHVRSLGGTPPVEEDLAKEVDRLPAPAFSALDGERQWVYGYLPVDYFGELISAQGQARLPWQASFASVRVAVTPDGTAIRILDNLDNLDTGFSANRAGGATSYYSSTNPPLADRASLRAEELTKIARQRQDPLRTSGGEPLPGTNLAKGVLIYSAGGVLLGAMLSKSALPENVQAGVNYSYAGVGVVMTVRAIRVNPDVLYALAPIWFGAEAGSMTIDEFLERVGVPKTGDNLARDVSVGLGGALGAGAAAYAATRIIAESPAAKTPVTAVFAMGAMTLSSIKTQADLDRTRDAFLTANPDSRVRAEFSHVCDVLGMVFEPTRVAAFGKGLGSFDETDIEALNALFDDPLTRSVIQAMGPWFVQQYMQYDDAFITDMLTMTDQASTPSQRKIEHELREIQTQFLNAAYSPERYEALCKNLGSWLQNWDLENLQAAHNLLYDPMYAPELAVHGEEILDKYINPFMEREFAFDRTWTQAATEWVKDLERSDDEEAILTTHRERYGEWALTLVSHVNTPDYANIVELPMEKAEESFNKTYVSIVGEGREMSVADLVVSAPEASFTVTDTERGKAEKIYEGIRWQGLEEIEDGSWQFLSSAPEEVSWNDDQKLIWPMMYQLQQYHDQGASHVVLGEVMKLWVREAKSGLQGTSGLSDAEVGDALRQLQQIETLIEAYQQSGTKFYLYSVSSPGGAYEANFQGDFIYDKMMELVKFVQDH